MPTSRTRSRISLFVHIAPILLGMACWVPPSRSGDEAQAKQPKNRPQYNAQGELKRPEGFDSWVFVGANLGLEYRDAGAPASDKQEEPAEKANFHNVYINPEAYEHYARTGKFPEGTVLVLDIYQADAGEPKSIVSHGRFPGKQVSVAVAVKDSARPDGSKTDWAYYEFPLGNPADASAKAFPNKACYDCHLQHADDDNVWVQFYPTLRKLHPKREKRGQ